MDAQAAITATCPARRTPRTVRDGRVTARPLAAARCHESPELPWPVPTSWEDASSPAMRGRAAFRKDQQDRAPPGQGQGGPSFHVLAKSPVNAPPLGHQWPRKECESKM